jgi:hypothetical protein
MTIVQHRLVRGAAVAFLAAGALSVVGTAAQAAPATADVTVELSSGTVAAGSAGKRIFVTVTNAGTEAIDELSLIVDGSGVDAAKVTLTPVVDCTTGSTGALNCPVSTASVKPGGKAEWQAVLIALPGAVGKAGDLVVQPSFGTTTGKAVTFALDVTAEKGPDLYAYAWDVPIVVDEAGISTGVLAPGETGPLLIQFGNQGDVASKDNSLWVVTPDGTSIDKAVMDENPADFEGCEFSDRWARCDFTGLVLTPASADTGADDVVSDWLFALPIKVDATAKAGVNLSLESVVEVDGDAAPVTVARSATARRAAVTAPHGLAVAGTADEIRLDEVANLDNTDTFTVFVKAAAGGEGGGDGDGNGDDPVLPITGPQVAGLGAAGAGVVAVGAMLFVLARRRRVVLVTPADETSPAA